MKKILISLVIVLTLSWIESIDLLMPASALQNASSGLILLYPVASATHYNPAYVHSGIESSYTRLFNTPTLPYYTFHLAKKTNRFGLYGGITQINHSFYRETSVSAAVNYSHENFTIGKSLRLLDNRVTDFHHEQTYLSDIGLVWRFQHLNYAMSIRNVTAKEFLAQPLPVVFVNEINYPVTSIGSISLGLEKEKDYDFCFKIGSAAEVASYLNLIASYQSAPSRIGLGTIVRVNRIIVAYSFLTHQHLSYTQSVSIGYDFSE